MTQEMIEKLFTAIDTMDTETFVSFINEDGTLIFGNAPAVNGKANIFETIDGFFKSINAIKHNIDNVIHNNEQIVIYGTSEYIRHDGSQLKTPYCNLFHLKDGLIQKYQIYIDLSELYK